MGPRAPAGSGEPKAAGARPGNNPLTIYLDSTVCETYGLAKEGAQRHNYAGQRANTTRGAAHFLRETVEQVGYAGATGPLTVRLG